jgi:hypothetical protein
VDWFVEAEGQLVAVSFVAEAGRREHAHRAGQHRGFVGQNIAEEIFGHDDIEAGGAADQMHSHGVDQDMFEFDVGVLLHDFDGDAAPEAAGGQDIGFVDAWPVFCGGRGAASAARRTTRSISGRV